MVDDNRYIALSTPSFTNRGNASHSIYLANRTLECYRQHVNKRDKRFDCFVPGNKIKQSFDGPNSFIHFQSCKSY